LFANGVNDTGGKFAAGVVDYISANFRKNENGLNGILWGWGKLIQEKKPEAKKLATLSL
jgi:hypothetical protein